MNKGVKKIRMNGKDVEHTRAIIRSQVLDLAIKKKIKTTHHKAKIISKIFDRLVTHAKKQTKSGVKQIEAFFGGNDRSIKRFNDIVKEFMQDRNSGYTRVIKTQNRAGDNAAMAYVMFSSIKDFTEKKKSIIEKTLEKQSSKKSKKSKL